MLDICIMRNETILARIRAAKAALRALNIKGGTHSSEGLKVQKELKELEGVLAKRII